MELRGDKKTIIIELDFYRKFKRILNIISQVQQNSDFYSKVDPKLVKNIEYWSAPYVLVNNLKAYFVEVWAKFYDLIFKSIRFLINQNIIDDDQGVYVLCLFKQRNFIKLNYLGKNKWFSLFKKYDLTSKVSFWEKMKDLFV